jgi:hypothetical protein
MNKATLAAAVALAALAGINVTTAAQGAGSGTEAVSSRQAPGQSGGLLFAQRAPLFGRAALRALVGSGFGHPGVGGYRKRPGWTNASFRRAALKKRNRAKHRAACKGGRSC